MSISIDENTIGLWFVNIPNGDILTTLSRTPDDNNLEIMWRFRYYRDEKAWDSKDKKHWYRAVGPRQKQEEVISHIRMVCQASALRAGSHAEDYYELLRGSMSVREFMELLGKQPFAHTKQVTEAEAREMGVIK